ncbi:MAG: MFS family permease [Myxococcota bacterium]
MPTPPTLRIVTELDRITIHLPRRVDESRLFLTIAGLSTTFMAALFLTTAPLMVWLAIICGLLMGLNGDALARLLRIRLTRTAGRSKPVDIWTLLGVWLMLLIFFGTLGKLIADTLLQPQWSMAIAAFIVLTQLACVPLSLRLNLRHAPLTLTAATLTINRQRWPLEDITEVETLKSGIFIINGTPVPVLEGLTRSERTWLKRQLTQRIATRRQTLCDAGHDLTQPATLPQALQDLRTRD